MKTLHYKKKNNHNACMIRIMPHLSPSQTRWPSSSSKQ
jgi:hypothetical protein